MERLDSYMAALRERCDALPDKREGRNTQVNELLRGVPIVHETRMNTDVSLSRRSQIGMDRRRMFYNFNYPSLSVRREAASVIIRV